MSKFISTIITIGNTDFKVTFQGLHSFTYDEWYADPHLHPFVEMHLVNCGNALIKVFDEKISLSDNYICIVPAKCYHSIESGTPQVSKMSFYLEIAKSDKSGEDTYSVFKEIFEAKKPFCKECSSGYLRDIFDIIKTPRSMDITNNKLQFLLSLLLCEIYEANIGFDVESPRTLQTISNTGLVFEIETYLNSLLTLNAREDSEIAFDNLAEHLYLSPSQQRRFIKKHFNCTYRELLLKYKMERAKILVEDNDITLERVAELLGYSTYTGFYKAFTKFTGTTPDKYRKNKA